MPNSAPLSPSLESRKASIVEIYVIQNGSGQQHRYVSVADVASINIIWRIGCVIWPWRHAMHHFGLRRDRRVFRRLASRIMLFDLLLERLVIASTAVATTAAFACAITATCTCRWRVEHRVSICTVRKRSGTMRTVVHRLLQGGG